MPNLLSAFDSRPLPALLQGLYVLPNTEALTMKKPPQDNKALIQEADRPEEPIQARHTTKNILSHYTPNYQQLVDFSPDAILIHDQNRIFYANLAALQLFGATAPQQLTDKSPADFVEAENRVKVAEYTRETVEGELKQELDVRLCRLNGAVFDAKVIGVKTRCGNVAAVQTHIRDISPRKQAEKALQQAYQIINLSPVVLCRRENSPAWPVEFVSANAKELLGYSMEDFRTGKPTYADLIYPADLQAVRDELKQADDGKTPALVLSPYRIVAKDGSLKWLDERTSICRNKRGEITHYESVIFDVTQSRQTRLNLQYSRQQLSEAQRIAHLGSWEWCVDTGEWSCSDEYFAILGHSKAFNLNYQTLLACVHPADQSLVDQAMTLALQQHQAYDIEYRIVRPGGEVRKVHGRGVVKATDEDRSLYMLGTVHDVTELRETESLRRRLGQLLDANFNEIYIFDRETLKFVYLNRGALQNIGYSMEEMRNMRPYDIKPDYDKESFTQLLAPLLRNEQKQLIFETVHQRKDGSEYPVEVRLQLFQEDGPAQYVAVILDISARTAMQKALKEERDHLEKRVKQRTEELAKANRNLQAGENRLRKLNESLEQRVRQRTKELEEANQAKGRFISNISHELRTPLNAILGYAQIFKEHENLTEKQIEGIKVIKHSGEHLLELINHILDLSKIDSQKLELNTDTFSFRELVDGVSEMIRVKAQRKDIHFDTYIDKSLPLLVAGDDVRLRQILLNLLSNAVKFTDEGRVIFRILRVCEKQKQQIRFEVEDTGAGVAPEYLELIFQPFQQGSHYKKQAEGTGLGLAISRKLVDMMGGALQVKSEPGTGSRFYFDLEMEEIAGEPQAVKEEPGIKGYAGKRRRILVVDDDLINRLMLVHMLEPLHFELYEAADGQQAVQDARKHRPDLILMDIFMPVMNGLEAGQQILGIPELSHTRLVAVSTGVSKSRRELVMNSGFHAFINKPVHKGILLDVLQQQLDLVWIAKEVNQPTKAKQALVSPPAAEVKPLYQAALMGDVHGISELVSALSKQNQTFQPFAEYVLVLLKEFRLRELTEFLKDYAE